MSAAPVRVLIVDDSSLMRTVISRTLRVHNDIEIVGTAVNGELGVKAVAAFNPDIVILDIEMPVMDGITALPLMLKEKPGLKVIICSTLSARGADISIKALSLGAAECILKPGGDAIVTANDFQEDLVRLVRGLASAPRILPQKPGTAAPAAKKFTLQPQANRLPPRVVAIGSSTGGPRALMDILKFMRDLPVPILITQHMPKYFTGLLAQNITQQCNIPCFEAKEGDVPKPGHVYIAPGGYHMIVRGNAAGRVIGLNEDPPENFCRPSVDPMLRSLVSIYGGRVLAVILTGMGNDGCNSCRDLVAAGGEVIAQDEATSVVWGMPGAVAMAGLCTAVIPLADIPGRVKAALKGAGP